MSSVLSSFNSMATASPSRCCFVQFPYPGEEHKPDGSGYIGWNKTHRNDKPNGHKRKFMEISGQWIGWDNKLHRDELWVWGEWEPESRLIRELNRPCGNQDYPRFLWQPYYVPRKSYRGLHKTARMATNRPRSRSGSLQSCRVRPEFPVAARGLRDRSHDPVPGRGRRAGPFYRPQSSLSGTASVRPPASERMSSPL